jgi:hypothetical protein
MTKTYADLSDEDKAKFKKYVVMLVVCGIIALLCIMWRLSK